jgi:GT2 family glycosyltransferase
MAFTQPAAHLWLQRLPITSIAASRILNNPGEADALLLKPPPDTISPDGLSRITINLELPPPEQAQQWLDQLRGEQAIWDPDPPRVCLMRALGLPAHWLDPEVVANGWLSHPAAIAPSCWSAQLGMAPPTEGALIVLGHAGVDWDKALAKESAAAGSPQAVSRVHPFSIDYRPGWFSLVTNTLEAALAHAGWLAAAAAKAEALIWIQAGEEASIRLLQADASAQLLQEQPPLTPTKLRARLTPRPTQALAEDRPSPPTESLFTWSSEAQPAVAVLVSLFNYSNRILDALNSVSQQRQRLLELIVVDDASSDDGAERVTAWMQEQIVADQNPFAMLQLVRHAHNGGLATARNTGFRLAKATWCFVLDADNILYPNALSACLALAEAGPDALAVVHPIIAVEAEPGMVTEQRSLVAGPSWQREILTQGNAVDAMALVRRRAWEAVGGYTHIEGGWEDYDLWCKLIEQGWHGLQCPRVLALYRSHPASMSATVTNSSWPPLRRTLQKRHPGLQLETG